MAMNQQADLDDAPELTDAFFEQSIWKIGGRIVTTEEGRAALKKVPSPERPKAETRNAPPATVTGSKQ